MKSAAVFSGRNGLDFSELRLNVVRIPEVSLRIGEAQAILDSLDLRHVELFSYITSDDDTFFKNIKLKSLASAIVQVGLFDRLKKTQRLPECLIGSIGGDSAMLVSANQISFAEMVLSSQALSTLRISEKVISLAAESAPLLSGMSLTEFQAFRLERSADGHIMYVAMSEKGMNLDKVIAAVAGTEAITQLIQIGPANQYRAADFNSLESLESDMEIDSIDSIELDPMLGWFWRALRPLALAQ
jgi:hypothetical protein